MKRKQKKQPARRAVLETIEPRILYSADFSPGLLDPDASLPETEQRVLGTGGEFDQQTTQQGQTRRHELVLVESNTPDYQKLIDDIVKQGGEGRDIEVVVLDASRDGIEQITDIMAARQDLDAVHLISYGANGQVQLGSTSLNFDTLLKSAAQIKGWGNSLSADADILLYGCDIAQDAEGRALVDALGRLTGADVAASVDLTGNALRGGDWDLEYNAGPMETAIAVSPDAQQTWQGLLDITTGLKGHWKLDANANDFSGNGYNGTLTNGAAIDTTPGTNKVGAGKGSFDGVNDYVDLTAYMANFTGLAQGTISAWIKTSQSGTDATIFDFSDTADANSWSSLYLTGGKLEFGVSEANTELLGVKSTASVADNVWHHVAVTVDATGNKLYIDGVQAAVTYTTGNAATQKFNNNVTGIDLMYIGGDRNSGGLRSMFTGLIDDVRFYDRGLSATDIAQLATLVPTIGDLSGDALIYSAASGAVVIDQGSAASVADIDSADFNTGTLTVSFAAGSDSTEDVLAIRNQGTGAGQIGVSGANVTYAGTTIGTWTGGSGGTNLVITLNANANPTNTAALLQNITYENTDTSSPTTTTRTVRFVLTDGDGGTSANYEATVASASASTPYMVTGTYTGNATDNRAITVGFQPDVVIVKEITEQRTAVIRTSIMSGDVSKFMNAAANLSADEIQSLDANGFTVGTGTRVNNASPNVYVWAAFKASAGVLTVGSYTGNGTSQAITGAGFSPELVYVLGPNGVEAQFRSSTDSNTYGFDSAGATANGVTSLDSDGFTVGSDATVNTNASVYYYVAWNEVPGLMDVGSYNGTGADNRNITGVGFAPEMAVVRSDATTAEKAAFHLDSHGSTDDESMYFPANGLTTPAANTIQQLSADGFQVGTHNAVNSGTGTYSYMAWRQQTAPTISNLTNQSTNEDTATSAIAFTVGDAETAAGSLSVRGASSNQTLVPDANIVFGGSGASRTVTITPAANQNGSVTITLTVNDGFSEATDTFTLTVNAVNDAPVASNDSYSVNEDSALSVNWWDTSWQNRQTITFDSTNSAENLTDFAVLVRLDASNIDFAKIRAGGADIRFVDSDGTPLAYEIESWDDVGETASVWVKVPQIDAGSNSDSIWVYYNNAAASDAQNAAGVWDANYVAVWHLNEVQASGTHVDSTGVNDATRVGNTSGTGQVAGGQLFDDANNAYIDAGSVGDDIDITKGTVSAWIKLNSPSLGGAVFNARVDAVNEIGMLWLPDDSGFRLRYDAGGVLSEVNIPGGALIDEGDGKQHLMAFTWDTTADEFKAFIDGAQYGSTVTGLGVLAGSIGTNVGIGANKLDGKAYYDGTIDEVRVSSITRSAEWIEASYLSQNGTFAFNTFGGQESAPGVGGVLDNDSDPDGDLLTAVLVSGPSNAASFTLNADGTFTYIPTANFAGTDSFTYEVSDGNGGTANGVVTITVNAINDAPSGTNKTVTTLEDTAYTFAAADFGFSDPNDSPANALTAVRISTVPGAGSLTLSGVAVTAGQSISVAIINAGNLKFTPAADANGAGYASFTFQVQDDGGTANGGVDLDASPNTITVNVTAVNDAPAGADNTVTTNEDTAYTFAAVDFGFSDASDSPADALNAVKITTLPGAGSLTLSGVGVTTGDFISLADIDAGNLKFTPAADANGAGYASFTFQVQDDGGTANGGVDLDASPNTITVNVTAVNDAPLLADTVVALNAVNEDAGAPSGAVGTLVSALVGGVSDADSGALEGIAITAADASNGTWYYSINNGGVWNALGAPSAASARLLASDANTRLYFQPNASYNGTLATAITFRGWDQSSGTNGGTADTTTNGGTTAFSAATDTASLTVTAITAPVATDDAYSINEDATLSVSWWDTSWQNRKEITFDNTGSAQNLADFPVLVRLDSSDIDFAKIKAGGADIRFLDADGTPLAYQIESWDDTPGSESATVWVKVPQIDAGSNSDSIWIYYNNAAASDAQNAAGVWDSAYAGVWHLNEQVTDEQTSGSHADSAGSNTGSQNGNQGVTGGKIGGAQDFDGTNDRIDLGVISPTSVTVSAWVKRQGPGDSNFWQDIVGNQQWNTGGYLLTYQPETSAIVFRVATAGSHTDLSAAIVDTTQWHYISGTFSGTTARIYVDGVEQGSTSAALAASAFGTAIGDDATGSGEGFFDGLIDEVRISNIERSADWIEAEYLSQNGSFAFTSFGTEESAPAVGGVLHNDTDTDNDLLSVNTTPVVDVSNGTLTLKADGTFTYTPNANFSGTDSFTYQVNDGNGGTATAVVTITVNAVNDAPAGADNTVTTNEDTAYTFAATDFGLTDPSDSPANALAAVKIATLPGAGSLTLSGVGVTAGDFISVADIDAGNLKFTPAADANGAGYASFTFQVQDDGGTANGGVNLDPSARTMTIDVTPVSDVVDDLLVTNEDSAQTINVLANDSFGPGAVVSAVTQGTHGTVGFLANGDVTYTPNADYYGADSFTYTATSGGLSETATVNVTVTAVADVVDDSVTTAEDTPVTVNVLANDSFAVGAVVTAVTQGANGTVGFLANGNVTYTPNADYYGADSFTYTVTSGGVTETATVNVTVTPAADVVNDSVTTAEDTPVTVNVLANDSFDPGAMVSAVTQGTHGTVGFLANGDVTYTPNADYNGADSFTYTVTSGGVTETATVNVTVTAVADVVDDSVTTAEDTPVTFNVLANDLFSGAVSLTSVVGATNGSISFLANGSITYTPNADFNGAETLTYTVTEDDGTSETASITVTVTPVADAIDDNVTTAEDTPVTFNVLGNDLFSGAVSLTSVVGATNGAVSFNAAGNVTYTPNADFNGAETLTYTVTQADATTETASVNLTINPINDAPVMGANVLTIDQGASVVLAAGNISASDIDTPAGALRFSVSNVVNGQFELTSAPSVAVTTFTQAEVLAGQVRFVHNGNPASPGYDVQVDDGALIVGPFSASVSFNTAPAPPGPPVTLPPVTIPPVTIPPAPVAPAPAAAGGPGAGPVAAGIAPGGAPANFNDLSEINVRLAKVEARVARARLTPPPEVKLNDYTPAQSIRADVQMFNLLPAQLTYTPSTPVDWQVAAAFGQGAEEQLRDELQVMIDSVKFGGMALSVGVVWWASRISAMLGSLLASTPAWRHIDPLPVVGSDDEDDDKWLDPNDREADANELAVSLVLDGGRRVRPEAD